MENQNSLKKNMNKSLTTNPELFSDNAWDLILESENEARRWRHEYLNVEHVLHVLFADENYNIFIDNLNINSNLVLDGLEGFLADLPISSSEKLFVGEELEELFDLANNFRNRWGSRLIEISHLLMALGRDKRIGSTLFEEVGMPSEILEAELKRSPNTHNLQKEKVTQYLSNSKFQKERNQEKQIDFQRASVKNKTEIKPEETPEISNNLQIQQEKTALEEYARDLTFAAKQGDLDLVIGREEEIRLVIKVLSRRGKNNPVLIGAPGVGKTAIAELLAQKIIAEEVPDSLKGFKLLSLDIGALIAGTKFRGQFEERLRSVLKEASNPKASVILFIDELHTLLSTERSSADAGSILKPILASGDLRCIGATTPENYRKTIEKDQALNRRFQQVLIKEPNVELSVEILRGIKDRYENHHGVKISDDALTTANRLADRYISDRCLPDKAIDLIDEAAAQLRMENTGKPQKIEKIEAEIKKLEVNLKNAQDNIQREGLDMLKSKIEEKEIYLDEVYAQWKEEKSFTEEINELSKEEEFLLFSIAEAREEGDLEKASKLQYDQLERLKDRKKDIEISLIPFTESGISLIRNTVEPEDIADVVARWTGIPVNKVLAGERQKLLNLEKDLASKVIGQYEAVLAVAAAIKRARAGMKDRRRPIGSFLFLGPTGVGKTELAKALANSLFDEEDALIRLDMSEFMERNAVARLLGAPPGYVGYEEGGQLTEAVRRRPYSVVLLDEIEKAHPDVFNILLQVLDDGRLTDSQGITVDFRHTVVVMTSNLASRKILESYRVCKENSTTEQEASDLLEQEIDIALRKQFRPEFLNRIDEMICFKPLAINDLQQIVQLQLKELGELLTEQNLELRVDQETIQALALEGYEPEYGARPLRRLLRRKIENPLANKLLEEGFTGVQAIRIKISKDKAESLVFFAET